MTRSRAICKTAKAGHRHNKGQARAKDGSNAIHKGLITRLALERLGGLRFDFELQGFDLILLIGNLFLLIRDLPLQGCYDGVPPTLLLTFCYGLVVLLYLVIAGIAGVPDEAIGAPW